MGMIEDHYDAYFRNWESLEELREAWEYEIPDRFNAGEFLCDRWAADQSNVAIYYEDWTADEEGTYTFQELQTQTNRLANRYHEYGLEQGDRIAVNVNRKREALIAYLAAWRAGIVPVPLSTLFGPDGLQYRIDDSGAALAVVDTSNLDAFREATAGNDVLKGTLVMGEAALANGEVPFWDDLERGSRKFEVADTAVDDDLILMYTSGTTGDPKGVRHGHRALFGHLPGMITNGYNLERGSDDILWTPVEFSWAGTMTSIIGTWSFGTPLVAFESGERFNGERAFDVIERYDVTTASIPPSGLRMMMQVDDPSEHFDVDGIRVIISGGESLGESVQTWAGEVFDAPVHESYGQTEIWNMVVGDCTALYEPRGEWMGRHLPGHTIEIVDPQTGDPLEPGEIGEIAVHRDDPSVLKGYWNKPDKTDAKFSGEWALTGDLGKRDKDGWFKFVSRKDDIIISSGYRISPVEVEESVATHEAVADAGVIGVPHEERGTVVKAFVVLVDGYEPSDDLADEVGEHVRDNLASYEYPREIEFLDELPRTSTGKIRRTGLRNHEGLE
jgi:acetyl-CoA synthetase